MKTQLTPSRLSNHIRYQKGLQIAYDAAQLLREKYQVKKIILFGSLSDINKFCSHSDIDLAVWGLDDTYYYHAFSDLSDLTSEFSFDLIQFESANTALQNLILRMGIPLEYKPFTANLIAFNESKSMNKYSLLIGQIQQEMIELETLVRSNQRLLDKIKATKDEDYLGTIALNLHSFYSGVERIFKQIAQTIDNSIPDTADWHRQLLRQMTATIPNIRPLVIRQETRIILDEYCSFRHVVRNIYSLNLKSDRVQKLAEELPNCLNYVREDLEIFFSQIDTV